MTILSLFFFCFLSLASHAQQVMTVSDSIVDYILFVDEAFIGKLPGKKGGSALVDHETFLKILTDCHASPKLIPGGSAVNMIKGLSHFGHECTLIAKVGDDAEGTFFLDKLRENGIKLLVETVSSPTGKSACLVAPDGERTMRTYLGASVGNGKIDLERVPFETLSLFHLEGYQLQHTALIEKTLSFARSEGVRVSMDLASFENVRAHHDLIWRLLIAGQIDLLFANRDEASVLTGLPPEEACLLLANYCDTVVITIGEKGCIAQRGIQQIDQPAFSVDAIDTTGAGDLFISGFLHGYLNGWGIKDCAWMGTLLASHVVQVVGAEIPADRWKAILRAADLRSHSFLPKL